MYKSNMKNQQMKTTNINISNNAGFLKDSKILRETFLNPSLSLIFSPDLHQINWGICYLKSEDAKCTRIRENNIFIYIILLLMELISESWLYQSYLYFIAIPDKICINWIGKYFFLRINCEAWRSLPISSFGQYHISSRIWRIYFSNMFR